MTAKITIDMDNAAFDMEGLAGFETARILRKLADKICRIPLNERPDYECQLLDLHGNTVGKFEVTP